MSLKSIRALAPAAGATLLLLACASSASAAVVPANDNWGIINRNVIGAADAQLRTGPAAPPFGKGSLNLSVANNVSKIAYGNESDFAGQPVSGLTAVGFQVFTTGENSALANPNMPSITFEINPNGAGGTTTTFSSLVFTPAANSPSNAWSPYIDATTTGFWGLTGSQFNSPATAANCGLNGPRCTFAQVQAFLATGAGATIFNAEITKGRDFEWHGAVDGLVVNNTTYDFELPTNTGPAGPAGPAGAPGPAGPAGPAAQTSAPKVCHGADLRTIHAPSRKGEKFLSARATLRDRALKVRGRSITVDLRSQPEGNYNVKITSRYRRPSGKTRTVKTTRHVSVACA